MKFESLFLIGLAVNAVLLIIILTLVYIGFINVGQLLVIYFDFYKGIDFLGTKGGVFAIAGTAAVVSLLNCLLAGFFYSRQRFLSYLLVFFTTLFLILILIAIGVIIAVN